eukprot:scaffold1133_cov84-Cylindrotheca_fusiformis.AAC.2
MSTHSLLSLFANLTAFQLIPAGYKAPIAVENTSPIQRILEQRRLQAGVTCTRTSFLGNVTTICEEASGIQSSCTMTPEDTCSYVALDTEFEVMATHIFCNTNSTFGAVSADDCFSFQEAFSILGVLVQSYVDRSTCGCTDSTPDCSMVANLTDYSFNACAAEPKFSRTCQETKGMVCCDVVDEKGEMKCCRSETETATKYECVAGSDTGKITLSNSSCVATHNGQSCPCEYCTTLDADGTTTVVAYDCTEVNGTKRTCRDVENKEFSLAVLGTVLGAMLDVSLQYEIVDPRISYYSASNGFALTVAFAISSILLALTNARLLLTRVGGWEGGCGCDWRKSMGANRIRYGADMLRARFNCWKVDLCVRQCETKGFQVITMHA